MKGYLEILFSSAFVGSQFQHLSEGSIRMLCSLNIKTQKPTSDIDRDLLVPPVGDPSPISDF